MNEHSFIRSVHRLLPKDLLVWKINDNFAGGVPDAFISGQSGSIWIEYKYIKALPKRPGTLLKTSLTKQQLLWLTRLTANGHKAWLVIGVENMCLILEGTELADYDNITVADFISNAVDKRTLVSLIIAAVLNEGADP